LVRCATTVESISWMNPFRPGLGLDTSIETQASEPKPRLEAELDLELEAKAESEPQNILVQ
jgi:hypothetical protein